MTGHSKAQRRDAGTARPPRRYTGTRDRRLARWFGCWSPETASGWWLAGPGPGAEGGDGALEGAGPGGSDNEGLSEGATLGLTDKEGSMASPGLGDLRRPRRWAAAGLKGQPDGLLGGVLLGKEDSDGARGRGGPGPSGSRLPRPCPSACAPACRGAARPRTDRRPREGLGRPPQGNCHPCWSLVMHWLRCIAR